MYPIVKKRVLNETVTLMEIEAPLVARKAMPGQFIIFRIDEEGGIVVLPQPFGPQITFMPESKVQSIESRLRTFEMNTLDIKECIPSNQE